MAKISKYIYEELARQIDEDIRIASNKLGDAMKKAENRKAEEWLENNKEELRDKIVFKVNPPSFGCYSGYYSKLSYNLNPKYKNKLNDYINEYHDKLKKYYVEEVNRMKTLKKDWILKVIKNQIEDIDISLPNIEVKIPKELLD